MKKYNYTNNHNIEFEWSYGVNRNKRGLIEFVGYVYHNDNIILQRINTTHFDMYDIVTTIFGNITLEGLHLYIISEKKQLIKEVIYDLYHNIKCVYPSVENCNGSKYLSEKEEELIEQYNLLDLNIYFETILYRVYDYIDEIEDYFDIKDRFELVVEFLFLTGVYNKEEELQVDNESIFKEWFLKDYSLRF